MKKELKETETRGITLITLVITIIVLLILAGITVNQLTGDNGILKKTVEAKQKNAIVQAKEKLELSVTTAISQNQGELSIDKLKEELEKNKIEFSDFTTLPVILEVDGGNFAIEESGTVTIVPDKLEIGSTVKYIPNGTYSNWKAEYCGSDSETNTLDSNSSDFKIDTWRVLSIEDGKVILSAKEPSKGTVYLGKEQGYNNGVKLLNDACSSLYGNPDKEITARSIRIEDIEKYMKEDKLAEVHQFSDSESAKYGNQQTQKFTGNNKNYPTIYAKEKLSVINEIKNTNGWKMSEQTEFIEKDAYGATNGKITTAESIHPYQTYWSKDANYMQNAFKETSNGINYQELLIIPNKAYWVASRCIGTGTYGCGFYMRCIYRGSVTGDWKCSSQDSTYGNDLYIYPIISVKPESITWNQESGFVCE